MNYTQKYNGDIEIVDESHYYPPDNIRDGLEHTYYNTDKKEYKQDIDTDDQVVIVQVADRAYDYRYNGQEWQDELGLNWYTYRHRAYDPAIGRFPNIDPISEKFYDISTNQFAHNTPIWKIELEGLEGIKSQEFDSNGNFKNHVIEKNVIVLTQKPIEKQSGISEKASAKIDKKNARISKRNAARVEKVRSGLSKEYSGAKNSKGESVVFDFNVTEMQVDKSFDQSTGALRSMAVENGLSSSEKADGGNHKDSNGNKLSLAITTGNEGEGAGLTLGNFRISLNDNSSGVLSHEVGHTLLDYGDGNDSEHSSTGLMTKYTNDMSRLTSTEVDKMLNSAYEK